jgi:hypothetical protein
MANQGVERELRENAKLGEEVDEYVATNKEDTAPAGEPACTWTLARLTRLMMRMRAHMCRRKGIVHNQQTQHQRKK